MRTFGRLTVSLLILGGAIALAQRGFFSTPRGPLKNSVKITETKDYRRIVSNGIPQHAVGQFPNRHNPNTARPQSHSYRVPMRPQNRKQATPNGHSPFGIALNGVQLDPAAAEFWNRDRNSGWQYEALSGKINLGLDDHNAHVQPNGNYHYHGLPNGLVKRLGGSEKQPLLLGYAADGHPIYAQHGYRDADDSDSGMKRLRSSWRVKQGARPNGPGGKHDGTFVQDYEYVAGSGDLDECNGRRGVTSEFPEGAYYYCLTEEFPFIPRFFRGVPDASFQRRGPPPGGRPFFGGPPPRKRPPPRKK
ncbi:MAG: YHYH protein [Planctomycetales bacterium]